LKELVTLEVGGSSHSKFCRFPQFCTLNCSRFRLPVPQPLTAETDPIDDFFRFGRTEACFGWLVWISGV